jgi:hypothetical protein
MYLFLPLKLVNETHVSVKMFMYDVIYDVYDVYDVFLKIFF